MLKLTKIDEENLIAALHEWFGNPEIITNVHFWKRNKVAVEIKNNLQRLGKWKNKARGNPRKGFVEMKKKDDIW